MPQTALVTRDGGTHPDINLCPVRAHARVPTHIHTHKYEGPGITFPKIWKTRLKFWMKSYKLYKKGNQVKVLELKDITN